MINGLILSSSYAARAHVPTEAKVTTLESMAWPLPEATKWGASEVLGGFTAKANELKGYTLDHIHHALTAGHFMVGKLPFRETYMPLKTFSLKNTSFLGASEKP